MQTTKTHETMDSLSARPRCNDRRCGARLAPPRYGVAIADDKLVVQARLQIGQQNDLYEKADRVARQVANAFTWTPAHEFGHIIGLSDRYSEGIMSRIAGRFGGQRATTAQPGYAGNLMAVSGGVLQSKNVRDIAAENEPSPYWINDDDQVLNWVNGHSLSDIGRLPATNKLKAIRTLMGGWISDDDVAAITRICSSVTRKTEADRIRAAVDLLEMTSIGQRTRVRVAFSMMP